MHWFIDPVKHHYVDFDGRVMRKPFWLYILIYIIFNSILSTVDRAYFEEKAILSSIFALALLLPSLGITTRRLHDTGRSGWWQLLWFIPIIGWIVLVVFLAQDTEKIDNAYGSNPKGSPEASVPQTPATPAA